MIKVERVEIVGWEPAIRGMRNPKNSWDKSDSNFFRDPDCGNPGNCSTCDEFSADCCGLGENDLDLAKRLVAGGPVHAKYRRMLVVYMDVTAPLYWWKEFDTYKVGTVANSCSTMHKIHSKPIEFDDFSVDYLGLNLVDEYYEDGTCRLVDWFIDVVNKCEDLRQKYLETNDTRYWKSLIQLLPSAYNQKRTIMVNYEVLANIYRWRHAHKLSEWIEFCKEIEKLPYAKELIIGSQSVIQEN